MPVQPGTGTGALKKHALLTQSSILRLRMHPTEAQPTKKGNV